MDRNRVTVVLKRAGYHESKAPDDARPENLIRKCVVALAQCDCFPDAEIESARFSTGGTDPELKSAVCPTVFGISAERSNETLLKSEHSWAETWNVTVAVEASFESCQGTLFGLRDLACFAVPPETEKAFTDERTALFLFKYRRRPRWAETMEWTDGQRGRLSEWVPDALATTGDITSGYGLGTVGSLIPITAATLDPRTEFAAFHMLGLRIKDADNPNVDFDRRVFEDGAFKSDPLLATFEERLKEKHENH